MTFAAEIKESDVNSRADRLKHDLIMENDNPQIKCKCLRDSSKIMKASHFGSSPPPPPPHLTRASILWSMEWFYKVDYEDQICLRWPIISLHYNFQDNRTM